MEERLEQLEQEIQQLKQQIRELPGQHQRQQLELQHQLHLIDPQNQQRQLQLLQQAQQRDLPELQQLLRQREEEQVQLQRLGMRRLPIITEAKIKTDKENAMFGEVYNGMNTAADAAAMDLIAEDESNGPYQFGYYPVSSSESESESESRKKPTRKLPQSSISRLGNFRKSAKRTLKRGANKILAGVNAGIIATKAVSDGVRLSRRSQKYQDARADFQNADVHPDLRAKATFGQYPLRKSDVIKSLGPRAIEKFLALNLNNSKKVTNVLDLDFNSKLYFIWVITTDGERIKIPIFAYPVESVIEDPTKPFTFARARDLAFVPYVYHDDNFYAEATNARSMLDLNSIRDNIGVIKEIGEHHDTLHYPAQRHGVTVIEEYSLPNPDKAKRLTEEALNAIIRNIADEEVRRRGRPQNSVQTVELYEYNVDAETSFALSILAQQKSASILDSDKPEYRRGIPTLHAPTIRELLGEYTFGPNVKNREAYLGRIAPPPSLPESRESKAIKASLSVSNRKWKEQLETDRDKRNKKINAEREDKRSVEVAKRRETDEQRAKREARLASFGNLGGTRSYKKTKRSKRHRKTKKRKNHRSKR